MVYNPDWLSMPVQQPWYGNIVEDLTTGYKAGRLPAQMRQEEEQKSQLIKQLMLSNENQRVANQFQPRQLEQGLRLGETNISYNEKLIFAQQLKNDLDQKLAERERLANIGSIEALTKGHQLDNEIKEETGMLNALLEAQGKNLTNKGLMQQQEWYPLNQGINALKGLGEVEQQEHTLDLAREFDRNKLIAEQKERELKNEQSQHYLKLSKQYDDTLTRLRILKDNKEITGAEYDNAIKRVNAHYQPQLKGYESEQAKVNVAATEAATQATKASTVGQNIKNEVDREFAREQADLQSQFTKGQISATRLANEQNRINNKYQEELKKLEIKQGKVNVTATEASTANVVASTQAQDFQNRLNGEYGEKDKKLAQQQAEESIKLLSSQNVQLQDNIRRQLKFGDLEAVGNLNAQKDKSDADRAKLMKDLWEVNKEQQAYQNVPEGSVPIAQFQKGTQTALIKEQGEMKKRIEGAKEGIRILNEMENILDRNPDFGKSFRIALTVSDKQGVINTLGKVIANNVGGPSKKVQDAEKFVKLSQDLVLKQGEAALGSRFTNAKYRGMQAAKPYVGNSKGANKAMINHMKRELEPLVKFQKDFDKAHYKYTIDFDYDKYSDIPLDQLSDDEVEKMALSRGLQ